MLGLSLQPGFDLADPNKRNVFVVLLAAPRPGRPTTGRRRPRPLSRSGYNQISRCTLDARDGTVGRRTRSERMILRVPKAKIGGSPSGFPGGPTDSGPGHVGGAGWTSTPPATCTSASATTCRRTRPGHSGYAPMDYRAAERWDARKTSANTADLRGKVLRIKPLADIAADAEPGVGSTYSIPAGNLFAAGTPNTRPEIYAMGFRQPFTVHTDPKNPGIDRRRRVLPRRRRPTGPTAPRRARASGTWSTSRATSAGRSASATSRPSTR